MEKGTCLVRYQGHQKTVSSLDWSPDGRFLASVSSEERFTCGKRGAVS